jgi:hypothetical protein
VSIRCLCLACFKLSFCTNKVGTSPAELAAACAWFHARRELSSRGVFSVLTARVDQHGGDGVGWHVPGSSWRDSRARRSIEATFCIVIVGYLFKQ